METATQELANPVLNDTDAKEAAELLNLASEYDKGSTEAEVSAQPDTRVPEPEPQPDAKGEIPDSPETKPETEKQERKRDAQGRFLKQDGSLDPDQSEKAEPEIKPDAKPETRYSKAQKDAERLDKSWKALEAEKAQERARIAAERDLLQRQQAEIERQRNAPRISPDGRNAYTAEQYVDAAREYSAQEEAHLEAGNFDEAKKYRSLAKQAQLAANEAWQYEQQITQRRQIEEQQKTWNANRDQAISRFDEPTRAELLKIGESELSKQVLGLLDTEQILSVIPNGFEKAVEIAKLRLDAGVVSGLREENTKLKAEVERLTEGQSLTGSGPTTPSPTKKFEDLGIDEMGEQLRQETSRLNHVMIA